MGRFSGGWVKAHRSLFNGDYDVYDVGILMWLIANANYVDGKSLARSGHKRTIIKRGQILTSVREVAEALGVANGLVRKRFDNFVNEQIIANETTNTGSIITICNYDKYQGVEDVEEQTVEQTESKQRTNREQTESNILKNIRIKEPKKVTTKPKVGTHEVIARYCELFEQRYGIKAAVGGVEAGQLGRITKAHGKEQAIKIIEGYFDLHDQFIANQCHPVGMIEKQINKILVSQSKLSKEPERRWLEIPTGEKQ